LKLCLDHSEEKVSQETYTETLSLQDKKRPSLCPCLASRSAASPTKETLRCI